MSGKCLVLLLLLILETNLANCLAIRKEKDQVCRLILASSSLPLNSDLLMNYVIKEYIYI